MVLDAYRQRVGVFCARSAYTELVTIQAAGRHAVSCITGTRCGISHPPRAFCAGMRILEWIEMRTISAGIRPFPGLHLIEAVQLIPGPFNAGEVVPSLASKIKQNVGYGLLKRNDTLVLYVDYLAHVPVGDRGVNTPRTVCGQCKITELVQCCGAEGAAGVVGRHTG